ncbi:alpha-L-fucosidase [Flavobacteriaceae bacterium]|nr:alpha-L-fucosidase [Flavobacteriaceae bacterium]MDA8948076.1 alpha-L-fucosidase [Flavobacteriaceae bacterium]MDA9572508.1 alpha-L-fucosidase [Flavobacteriaceae bacterium]MDC3354166.1 alpha-L-fucosidase [Flavobacteriaceae bacterium]
MNHSIYQKFFLAVCSVIVIASCTPIEPPLEPVNPVPNEQQLAWQELEYYAFIHFNMNTFTNKEWGYGDESPSQFNPTELDVRQWARVAKKAGMKGIIITAKHHDGFCLWPSEFTEHSVKNSPWSGGKGDLIQELSNACKEYGLKFGVYLSPWDRNHSDYGKPEYISYFRNQLRELLTNYGEIFEVWFDGANGGDGYYGGANEERRVDKKSYYDWPTTIELVRSLQPQAVIFSDAGPDIRWVGNEKGYANETTWSPIFRDSVYAGMPDFQRFASGQENGTHWVPAETDVSIRPGWYYHPEQDNQVKSLSKLVDIYYNSVGLNSSLLLNLPVDTRGLVHENEVANLNALADYLKTTFSKNYSKEQKIQTSSTAKGYDEIALIDEDKNTYWVSKMSDPKPTIELQLENPEEANTFMIQEYLPMGQRIKSFYFEVLSEGSWKKVYEGTTIGNKRLIRFDTQTIEGVRFTITDTKAQVVLSNMGLFRAPDLTE